MSLDILYDVYEKGSLSFCTFCNSQQALSLATKYVNSLYT